MTRRDKQKYQTAFDSVFRAIKDVYPFLNKKHFFVFKRKFLEYRRRLAKLDAEADFFALLKDFLLNLKNSHTKLGNYPGKVFYQPSGYSVASVSGKYFLKRGNKTTGLIISINGKAPEKIMAEKMKKAAASTKQYAFSQGLKLVLGDIRPGLTIIKLKNVNKITIKRLSRRPVKFKLSNGALKSKLINRKGYLKIKSWTGKNLSENLEKKLKNFQKKKIKSLIIDVRDNGGGDSDLAKSLASHFFGRKVVFGAAVSRKSKNNFCLCRRKIYVEPAPPYYDWPLYILIGPSCFSSNEYFIGGLKDNRRVVLIGETTGGGSGNPKKFIIALGKSSFELFVSRWIFYRANGKVLEGRGIEPDIAVSPKIVDFRRGKDVVLARTLIEASRF